MTFEMADFDPKGQGGLVVGAGGAARAVLRLPERGGAKIWITNRTRTKADELAKIRGTSVTTEEFAPRREL